MKRLVSRALLALAGSLILGGCVTSTVDEMVYNEPTEGIGDSTVVILGRRHASDYETEPDFIQCVGKHISSRDRSIEVMGELDFINALYPWFEPRTAPLRPEDIDKLMVQPPVAAKMAELKTEYMIWIDGSTPAVSASAPGVMNRTTKPPSGILLIAPRSAESTPAPAASPTCLL
jgi:hypothetical protein